MLGEQVFGSDGCSLNEETRLVRTYYQGPRLPTRWELDQRLGLDQHEPDKSTERWRDAVHEAGHCLAAKDRGIEIVTVVVGRGPVEEPHLRAYVRTREVDNPWGICVVDMAGGACDAVFFGMSDTGSRIDCKNVWANAFRVSPDVDPGIASKLVDHARAVARDLVELNREAIERLATELYHRGELDGDMACRVLGPLVRPKYRPFYEPREDRRAAHSASPRDRREGRTHFRAVALPSRGDGLMRRVDGYVI